MSRSLSIIYVVIVASLFVGLFSQANAQERAYQQLVATPIDTTSTYQGGLNNNGTPAMFALPEVAAPHATVRLRGYGFTPDFTNQLSLTNGADVDLDLGEVTADDGGEIDERVTLPGSLSPGEYALQLWHFVGENPPYVWIVAVAPLTVIAPPTVSLTPSSGPPGTSVQVTVDNLRPGSLLLHYAGVPVLGPVPVKEGLFETSFVVPGDRPGPLGGEAKVVAINLIGGIILGAGEATFQSQEPTPDPDYVFQAVQLPERELFPGDVFSLTGRIEPIPPAPLDQHEIDVVWVDESDQVALINTGPATINPDGSFQVPGRVPSLFTGGALEANQKGGLGLLFTTVTEKSREGAYQVSEFELISADNYVQPVEQTITFRVVNKDQPAQPIENALINLYGTEQLHRFSAGEGPEPASGNEVILYDFGDLHLSGENQLNAYLEGVFENYDPLELCADSESQGFTDENGEFTVELDADLFLLTSNAKIKIDELGNRVPQKAPSARYIEVDINALLQGYGEFDADACLQPQVSRLYLMWDFEQNRLYRTNAEHTVFLPLEQNPVLKVAIPDLPDFVTNVVPIMPQVAGLTVKRSLASTGCGDDLVFGDLVSFSDASTYPDAMFNSSPKLLKVSFWHNGEAYGAVNRATLHIDGQEIGEMENIGLTCGLDNYSVTIPNAHRRYQPGKHTAEITVEVFDPEAPGNILTSQREFTINYIEPPAWIVQEPYINPEISWSPHMVMLQADKQPEDSGVSSNVDYIGQVENETEGSGWVREIIHSAGSQGIQEQSKPDSEVVNNDTAPKSEQQSVAPGSDPVKFGYGPDGNPVQTTILDTGMIPLFRYGWGVWPIASATFGADIWFKATLSHYGSITLDPDAGPLSDVVIKPGVNAGIEVFFDLSMLLGLIEAHAGALPTVDVTMPVVVEDNAFDPSQSGACFRFILNVMYEVSVGVCPVCIEVSDVIELFSVEDGNPSDAVCDVKAVLAQEPVTFTSPPSAHPTLAVDGFGQGLALWVEESKLNARWLHLQFADPPEELTRRPGLTEPVVAFYAPKQAMAVWVENALTEEAFLTLKDLPSQQDALAQAVRNQRLVYALGDGDDGSWSEPQVLTPPTSGEGDLALAGCMSTDPACPEEGAVTVVWARDVAGDLAQRQFRLYYATYQNGSWSTPQPVDPESTATDSQPSVAYVKGVPVVTWVRNPTRSLAQLSQRRLAYRFLDGTSPVVTPRAFPSGIASPSLAADSTDQLKLAFTVAEDPQAFVGNQRTLHMAERICVGTDCTWSVQKIRDTHGRDVRGERPIVTVDAEDRATVTFRGLGFGPDENGNRFFPEDPSGIVKGTGELAQVEVTFDSILHDVVYLSLDDEIDWQPSAVYDPASNAILTMHVKGAPIPDIGPQRQPVTVQRVQALNEEESVFLSMVSRLPDFKVVQIVPETAYPNPLPGQPVRVTAHVTNEGVGWQGEGDEIVELVATWGKGPGLGIPADTVAVPALAAGQSVSLTLALDAPVDLDHPHRLFVTVNPSLSVLEVDGMDNQQSLELGGLPAPENLRVLAEYGTTLGLLQWDPVADRRVAGYRIYRAEGDGPLEPLGTSLGAGYVDVMAFPGVLYRYGVTSYTDQGIESDVSEWVDLRLHVESKRRVYLPLVLR
jgi:hypothetical protein